MRLRILTLAIAIASLAGVAFAPANAAQDLTMPTCGAGDTAVWVNTKTKVYHAQGDPIYTAHTKNGKYACTSDAVKMGAHAAKSGGKKGAAMASPDAMASGAPHKKRRGKRGAMATAMPTPTATP